MKTKRVSLNTVFKNAFTYGKVNNEEQPLMMVKATGDRHMFKLATQTKTTIYLSHINLTYIQACSISKEFYEKFNDNKIFQMD